MNAVEILATLKKLGKPQTAAIYRRHGAGENVFGTLTSEIAKLQKKIKVDHKLGMELWMSGNAEARILALQIFDPQLLTREDAERFVGGDGQQQEHTHFLNSYLVGLLGRSPIATETMRAWMGSPDEFTREAGYGLLSASLKNDSDFVSDAEAGKIVKTIEKEIHSSPNMARHAMNGALIAIGVFKPSCREKVMDAAKRIGKVTVDHGETNCKTPDAAAYIEKASQRER